MTFKLRLAKHLDVTGDDDDDDEPKWGSICKVFWIKYYFLIGIVCVLTVAGLVPYIGSKSGPLATPITASWIAICTIFLVTGLGVKTRELRKATLFWQLNLFVHFFIYIYFPCIGMIIASVLKATTNTSPYLLDGLVILCCLPTTISSAVVLTVNSDGNEAAAVVNTAVANVLGIFMTPALIFVFLGNLGDVDIGNVFLKLSIRVIAPFGLGQIIRNVGRNKVRQTLKKIKPFLKKLSETLLLYIIFCAISESFYTGLDANSVDIITTFAIVACLHVSSLIIVWYLSGIRGAPSTKPEATDGTELVPKKRKCCASDNCLRFTLYDRIAILFCATQKTAAFGIPIVSSLFETSDKLGIYLVPLLIYHPLQLVIDSFLVQPLTLKVSKYEKAVKLTKGDEEDLVDSSTDKEIIDSSTDKEQLVPLRDEESSNVIAIGEK